MKGKYNSQLNYYNENQPLLSPPPSEILSDHERTLLAYINRVGCTAPLVLQAKFGLHKKSVQEFLTKLHCAGYILRPLKGLIVSKKYYRKHSAAKKRLEHTLRVVLPL